MPLPREFTPDEIASIGDTIVEEDFRSRGLVCTWNTKESEPKYLEVLKGSVKLLICIKTVLYPEVIGELDEDESLQLRRRAKQIGYFPLVAKVRITSAGKPVGLFELKAVA